MIKKERIIIWLFCILMVSSSCNFSQEDLTNRVKKIIDEQASKIDSSLAKEIDHQVNDADSIINQTSIKSIRDKIDQKIKESDTLIQEIKKGVDVKQIIK